jgi:putative redox protein
MESKTVHARWSSGLSFEAGGSFGGRVGLEGQDGIEGLRPSELVLAALAACAGMDVVSIATKKRQVVTSYEVVVHGEQEPEHPRTFSEIVMEHQVDGSSIDDVAIARAIELSATRYCVVTAQLSSGDVAIRHRYRIRDAAGERSAEVLATGPRGAGLQKTPDQAGAPTDQATEKAGDQAGAATGRVRSAGPT